MKAYEIIRAILDENNLSPTEVSKLMGRAPKYLSTILSRKSSPQCEIMALCLDAMGYDLVARCRHEGTDYVFEIPERDIERQLLESLSEKYEIADSPGDKA